MMQKKPFLNIKTRPVGFFQPGGSKKGLGAMFLTLVLGLFPPGNKFRGLMVGGDDGT